MQARTRIAIGSLVVGVAVLGLKTLAWAVTGSVALLSDALESVVNVATAGATLLAVRVAARPADDDHPYGHDKAEYLSAVAEGVLIVLAALLILREAWSGLMDPRAIEMPVAGLVLSVVATGLNAVWSRVLVRRGDRLGSPALVADGRHLWTDVITSAGVLAGVMLAAATGWALLDPAIAALVAGHILWSGTRVLRESVGGLMDAAVPEATLAEVRAVIAAEGGGAVEAHDIKTRHAGRSTFVDFHLVVPGEMTVNEAHEICDRIEAALRRVLGPARIGIHVEPEHKAEDGATVLIE